MNHPKSIYPAKTHVTLKDVHICPCCNLIKSIYSFIDPVHFTTQRICNECRTLYNIPLSSSSLYSPLSSQSNQATKKQITTKVKQTTQQSFVHVVPYSSWSVVSPQKAQKLKNVYYARLIFHRIVFTTNSSIQFAHSQ